MKLVILSTGALYVSEKEQSWLFGAPSNVKETLEELGMEPPQVVFTTSLKAPGIGNLGKVLRFKEQPLTMNGLSAKPVTHKHGTDYIIDCGHARVLFSERGDVAVQDTEGFDLAIIKNKHRADNLPENVITWPWENSEYIINDHIVTPLHQDIRLKVWADKDEVPENLQKIDDTPLSVEQANYIARIAKASGEGDKENWAIAISSFKKSFEQKDGKWVKREKETIQEVSNQFRSAFEKQYGIDPHISKGQCWYIDADLLKNIAYVEKMGEYYAVPFNYGDDGQIVYDLNKDNWMPADKQWVIEYKESKQESNMLWFLKEMTDDGPIQRFGDVLIGALHTAYNDVSDHYLRMGYMDEDERKSVGKSIGAALDALRKAARPEVMSRVVKCDLPSALKEELEIEKITVPDELTLPWSTVYKDSEGQEVWASISSVAVWDNQGELFQTKAMDFAMKFGNSIKFKGPLRFRHIPGLDGGDCTHWHRVGDFLFEKGTFRDTPLGEKMKTRMKEGNYGTSLGLLFSKNDLVGGVYEKAIIFERSMTRKPAVGATHMVYIGKESEVEILTKDQLEEVSKELELPLDDVRKLYEGALASGTGLSTKELKEKLKANGGGAMAATDDEDEEPDEGDEKMSKKEMLQTLENLTLKEFRDLENMIAAVKAGKAEDEKDYEEVEDTGMAAKESDRLEKLLTEQSALIQAQTKALQSIINGKNAEVSDLLSALPRQQALTFANATKEAPVSSDADVMAKLTAIEKQLKEQKSGPNVYDMFTSQSLNK